MVEYGNITTLIRAALTRLNLQFNYDDETNYYSVKLATNSRFDSIEFLLRAIPAGGFLISARPELAADVGDRELLRALAELILRLNAQNKLMVFNVDFESGRLRCEVNYPCCEGYVPSVYLIQALFVTLRSLWERCAPCFLSVMYDGKEPEIAIKDALTNDRDDARMNCKENFQNFPCG